MEVARRFEPVPDIEDPFETLSYSYSDESVSLTMHGEPSLSLRLTGVVALRFERECPGVIPLPSELPMLRPGATFPLIVIDQSEWWSVYEPIYRGDRRHFVFLSGDDLLHVIANANVFAEWLRDET